VISKPSGALSSRNRISSSLPSDICKLNIWKTIFRFRLPKSMCGLPLWDRDYGWELELVREGLGLEIRCEGEV